MNTRGLSAEQIAGSEPLDISTWHFFQAIAWLDYVKRKQAPMPLHYASLELRLGLEYLLFELLFMVAPSLTEKEYQGCLGDPHQIKRLITAYQPQYDKLCTFTRITLSLQPGAPRLRFWKLSEVFKYWGIASELCHFPGTHGRSYADEEWFIRKLARLEKNAAEVFQLATSAAGHGLLEIASLPPEVLRAWQEFAVGTLAEDDLKIRLNIMHPILRKRRIG